MFFLKYTEIPKSICKGRKKQLQASSMQEEKKAFKENIPDTDKQLQEKKQKQQQQPQQLREKNTSFSFSLSKTKTGCGYVQER